jgi:hypothetical protein
MTIETSELRAKTGILVVLQCFAKWKRCMPPRITTRSSAGAIDSGVSGHLFAQW